MYSCCDGGVTSHSPTITPCPTFSSTSTLIPPATTIAPPSSSSSPKSSSSSSSSSSPSSFTLQSLRAAWRSLSSLGFSTPRLPHLERAASTPDSQPSSSSGALYNDYRYTQFPTASSTAVGHSTAGGGATVTPNVSSSHNKKHHKDSHRSPTPSLAHCLRRRRTKSKSDNALQTVGVRLRSRSDHNLHRVCLVGGSNPLPPPTNAVFSNVQLSSGSSDSFGTPLRGHCQRSRSLERTHRARINSQQQQQHTRSLERNHKFRIHLRSPSRDIPPDHPAPPPPTNPFAKRDLPPPDGSGGSVSICSNSSSSSNSSTGGGGGGGGGGTGTASAAGMEGGQGGSFINKPPRGWLHPDQQLAEEGICYGVRVSSALGRDYKLPFN